MIRDIKIKKIYIPDIIYIIAFSIFIISAVLETTMFNVYIRPKVYLILRILSMIIILVKVIAFDIFSFKQLINYLIFGSCLCLIYTFSGYTNLLYLAIILLGAKNVSLKKIVKTYFIITVVIIISAIISSKLGIIENLQYFRSDGKMRQAFGSVYPTDFASHIFYLILSYCYIKKGRLSYCNMATFTILALFLFYYCDARLDSISIIITILAFLFFDNRKKIVMVKKLILVYAFPICILISIVVTMLYKKYQYTPLMASLNELLSGRLSLGSIGIDTYGFSAFGQQIIMNGNGGKIQPVDNYFFIDCSYLSIALKYGVIFLTIICIIFIITCKKYIKNSNVRLPLIITLIAINSMVAHHLLDLAYNPFILSIVTPIEAEIYKANVKKKLKVLFNNKRVLKIIT